MADCLSAAAATDNDDDDDDEPQEARDDPAIPTHAQCMVAKI